MDEVQRLLDGLPRLAALRGVREELSVLEDLPEPPASWAEDLQIVVENEVKLTTQVDEIDGEIQRLVNQRDQVTVDEEVIGTGSRVDRLKEAEARYRTAEDIPNRRLDLNTVVAEIEGILKRLDQNTETDTEGLILPASTVGILRDLIESRSGISTTLESARKEKVKAQEDLEEAREKLQQIASGSNSQEDRGQSLESLASVVSALRAADHAVRQRLAERSRATRLEILTERLDALKPWGGDAEALAQMTCPESGQIEIWKGTTVEIQRELSRYEAAVEDHITERDCRKAEIEGIRASAGEVDDETASDARATRDEAWTVHREVLDASTADFFEKALRQ